MATSYKPVRAKAYAFNLALVDATTTTRIKKTPTIDGAGADFRISKDNGTLAALTNLPVESPAGSGQVLISLTASEMDADRVTVLCIDATSTPEWCDQVITIETRETQIDYFQFLMRDASGNEAPGKTGIAASYALDGATSFSALAGTITEVGNGYYRIPLTRALMSSWQDSLSLRFTVAGCMPTDITLMSVY